MRKSTNYLLLTAAMLAVCSCGDELVVDGPSQTEAGKTELTDLTSDLTCGYNLVIFDQATLDNAYIPLKEGAEVEIVSAKSPYYEFVESTNEGQPCLKIAFTDQKLESIIQDKVCIRDVKTGAEKTVMVVVRPSFGEADSRAVADIPAAALQCLKSLGMITHPLTPNINSKMDEVFDLNLLKSLYATNEYMFTYSDKNSSTTTTLRESTSRNAQAKTTSNSWGMDLTIPIKSVVIGFQHSGSVTHSTDSEESREFLYLSKKSRTVSMRLKNMYVYTDDAKTDSAITYFAMMNAPINDKLNNPGSGNYQMYPLTEEGTYKLIDELGGYQFNSAVILGGEATKLASKRNTMSRDTWKHSIEFAASVAPRAGDLDLDSAKIKVLKKYKDLGDIGKVLMENYRPSSWKGSVNYKNEKEEVNELASSNLEVKTMFFGGNANTMTSEDVDKWAVGNDPEYWIPICFANDNYYDLFMQGANDSDLKNTEIHSILELCLDSINGQPNPRYKLLKDAITPNADGIIPYYSHRKYYSAMQTQRLVVVDAICKPMPKNDQSYPVEMEDAMGHSHLYYPLVANTYMDKIVTWWRDKVFPINADQFTGSDWMEGAEPVVLWVALDWANTTPGMRNGIVDIWIDKWNNEDSSEGIYRRGIYFDYKVKGSPEGGANYLFVQYANDETPLESLITGVSLYATEWDKDNGSIRGKALAASPGTEYLRSYSSTANKNYFNKYWGPDADWFRGEYQKEHGHSDITALIKIKGDRRPHTAQIGYTTKRIERDIMDTHVGADNKKMDISVLGELPRTNNNILTVLENW